MKFIYSNDREFHEIMEEDYDFSSHIPIFRASTVVEAERIIRDEDDALIAMPDDIFAALTDEQPDISKRVLSELMLDGEGVVFADRCFTVHGKPVVIAHLFYREAYKQCGGLFFLTRVSDDVRAYVEDRARTMLSIRDTQLIKKTDVPPTISNFHYLSDDFYKG